MKLFTRSLTLLSLAGALFLASPSQAGEFTYAHGTITASSTTATQLVPAAAVAYREVYFGELANAASFYFKVGSSATMTTDGWLVRPGADSESRINLSTNDIIYIQIPAGNASRTIHYMTISE